MRIIKRLKIPDRVIQIRKEAEDLFEKGYFSASIGRLAIYIQQMLIITTLFMLREENIQSASVNREKIEKMVSGRRLTMGKVIDCCRHIIYNSVSEELLGKTVLVDCDDFSSYEIDVSVETLRNIFDKILDKAKKISIIRNEISEHPGFVISLDPSNQFKNGMYDTNYYRKFINRKLKFLEEMEIPCKDIKINSKSYFDQHPLTSLSRIEDFFDELSKQIEQTSASIVMNFVTELDCLFTKLITNIHSVPKVV